MLSTFSSCLVEQTFNIYNVARSRVDRRGHPIVAAALHAEPDAEQGRLRDGVRR